MNKNKIKSFTDLIVWKKHKLASMIYSETKKFPKKEMFGLTSQIRRASVSITSNIAEGFSRNHSKEKYRFCTIAQGSLIELQNQLIISRDVGLLPDNKFLMIANQTVDVHKLINGLKRLIKHKF